MDSNKGYNGWSNYATWRINLEIWSDQDADTFDTYDKTSDLVDYLKQQTEEVVSSYGEITSGLALDYAMAFISDVDYWEIARHLMQDNSELVENEAVCAKCTDIDDKTDMIELENNDLICRSCDSKRLALAQ